MSRKKTEENTVQSAWPPGGENKHLKVDDEAPPLRKSELSLFCRKFRENRLKNIYYNDDEKKQKLELSQWQIKSENQN